jgi:hypothetical protein
MNKKLEAMIGSVLILTFSLATPVLASVTALKDIGNMVTTTGNILPTFVIGEKATTDDVAGAVNIAVGLAQYAKTTSTITTTTTAAGITGGVSMATSSNPLVMWNNFASSKQVLTATDLPDVLKSGTYTDANSVSTPYSQYLSFTNSANYGQIVYDTPSGGTTPALGLKFAGTYYIYTYQLAFTKRLSEAYASSSVTYMINTQLDIMGRTWTITSATAVTGSNGLAITMLSGKNSQTVTTETPATFTSGDKTYTVKLVAVGTIGGTAAATIAVSGGGLAAEENLQILSGGTKALSDATLVGVTSIFTTTKTGSIDSATIFIGADKLELEDTDVTDSAYYAGVKVNGVSLTDVTVSMTGTAVATPVTLNTIEVRWTPSLEQFVTVGNSLTDPAFGGFKIFFGGINPALDDTTNRETITVTPSGTTAGLSFKTTDGNSLNQNFVKTTSTTAGAGNIALQDAGGYALHVIEGELVGQNEYAILGQNYLAASAQNPFGHIIRVLSLQTVATSTSQFQDVASGTTIQVTGGNTTMYLDGQAYKVCVWNTTHVAFTWGTNALYCAYGGTANETIDLFPTIQTSKGAWVALQKTTNITGLTNATSYTINLPTGSTVFTTGSGGNATGVYSVGAVKYYLTNSPATSGTWLNFNATDNLVNYSTPSVLVVEGLDENQVRNAISLRLDSGATYVRVEIAAAPGFTGTKTSTAGVSGTTLNKYMDQFGAFVTYDSTAPGTFSLSCPSSQAQATVGVGKSPAASGGGAGGTTTTQTVLPITADIVKIDKEYTAKTDVTDDVVIVGGPCVNKLAAWVLDKTFPACGADSGLTANTAVVQLFNDKLTTGKAALLVAGWEAVDTNLAALMVQKGFPGATTTQTAGAKLIVTGTVTSPAYS